MPEEREMEAADTGSAEFTAPGFGAKFRGAGWGSRENIVVIVMFACTAFLYVERIQSNRGFADQHLVTQAQIIAQSRITQELLGSIIKTQNEMTRNVLESNEIQSYVLSLPQVQRERLNLSMPPTLRARIRSNSQ